MNDPHKEILLFVPDLWLGRKLDFSLDLGMSSSWFFLVQSYTVEQSTVNNIMALPYVTIWSTLIWVTVKYKYENRGCWEIYYKPFFQWIIRAPILSAILVSDLSPSVNYCKLLNSAQFPHFPDPNLCHRIKIEGGCFEVTWKSKYCDTTCP